MIEIGINGWYFRNMPPEEIVEKAVGIGFKKIEFSGKQVSSLSIGQIRSLRGQLEKNRMDITAVNTACDLIQIAFGDITSPVKDERKKAITHILKCIKITKELGGRRIIIDTGTSHECGTHTIEQQKKLLKDAYLKILEKAIHTGIQVSIVFIPTRMRIRKFTKELIDRWLGEWGVDIGWVFDTANELASRENIYKFSLIKELRWYKKRRLDEIHISNHPGPFPISFKRALYHFPVEEGYYKKEDFQMLFNKLKENKFKGDIICHITEKFPNIKHLKQQMLGLGVDC